MKMSSTTGLPLFTPQGEYMCVKELPPMWLFYVWLVNVVLFYVSICGGLDFLVGMCGLVYINVILYRMSVFIIKNIKNIKEENKKKQFFVDVADILQPQGGEDLSKENRRDIFFRRAKAIEKEQIRRMNTSNKKKKKKRKGSNKPYKPQLGMSTVKETFASLSNISGIPCNDALLSKIENLCACFFAIKDCETLPQLLAILFLYFKTHYSKSVANGAAEYISAALDCGFSPQLGEFEVPKKKEKPKWLSMLKECQENWTLVLRNEGFSKISQIISICLALGLCDAAALDFRIGGMKLFSVGASAKHATAVDLVDATFETITYFVEGGYSCFERGSIKPLLYGNMENEEFEVAFSKCLRCHEYARAGNLGKFEKNDSGGPMTENDFDALLNKCIEKCTMLINTCRGLVEKNVLRRKQDMLRMWQAVFCQTRVQGGLREAPYSIGVYGGTAVGKSSIANVLMVSLLQCNNLDASDDKIITINESDKYMSTYRSYINGILIDDIGNTKAQFVEKAPTTLMIQLVNNVRMYANMAEAELKGKVSVEPKVVIATKNVKDSCASVYSNEPASITRRERVTLTATVKPEFATHSMLDDVKVKNLCPHLYTDPIWRCPDLWYLKVERSYPLPNSNKGGAATVGWETIVADGKPMDKITLPQFLRWAANDSKYFYENQANIVAKSNNIASKMTLCEKCRLSKPDVCICSVPSPVPIAPISEHCVSVGFCTLCAAHHNLPSFQPLKAQLGEKVAMFFLRKRIVSTVTSKLSYWANVVEERGVDWMVKRAEWLETSPWCVWTNWIPSDWLNTDYCKMLVIWSRQQDLEMRIRRSYLNHICISVLIFVLAFLFSFWLLILLPFNLQAIAQVITFEKNRLYSEISADNAAMPAIFKMYRDRHVKWITGLCVAIAAIYGIACVWKALRVTPRPQGNIAPTAESDIIARDADTTCWALPVVTPMPCTNVSKTTTIDQLDTLVQNNLCYMELFKEENGMKRRFYCNAFFPKSNVAIVPNHMWLADTMFAKFTRHDPNKIGGNFSAYLYKGSSVHIPNTDYSLVWVPNGGDWRDLTQYLPVERFNSVPGRLLYKRSDGSIIKSSLYMNCQQVQTIADNFYGAKYNLSFPTFEGLCMAPIVTETKGPTIGGFHLAGKEGSVNGCSGLLLKQELDRAFEELKKRPSVLLGKSEGEIPKAQYGVQYYLGNEVHPKSPINYLPEGTNCKYYGQVTGRAKYFSEVTSTLISPLVAEVCGVPQKWGQPKFRESKPFRASLQYSTKPSVGVEGDLVVKACQDYYDGFVKELDKFPILKKDVRPLVQIEVVCGIDGKRFIDKMPPDTSVGYPLSGPKKDHLTYLDPEGHPTHQCPAELNPVFWEEADKLENLYRKGERGYPIFKACLKDEPTKLDKDKVRVFQGAPLALQLIIRKYFLPIARVLSMLPLTSECAVGINAQGTEWHDLTMHVTKYGKNRILAGDYSKYDLRMPAQILFAAFKILIDIAVHCGYTKEDVTVMEGIATDISYPLMAYNGDLIQHIGSHPSGQNLTAYVNSMCNSILFRCAYYHITRQRVSVPPFRNVCALITYGDDAKSSVHADYPEFNHLSMATFLADHDMKFTMPDKTSEPKEYMTDEEADFLKRASKYCSDTGKYMGALSEDSIFKSLHAVISSGALTKEQQAMVNIDGALREWFNHGRDKYELRRSQMKIIAERAKIDHGCLMLNKTFDDQLLEWKEKYMPNE